MAFFHFPGFVSFSRSDSGLKRQNGDLDDWGFLLVVSNNMISFNFQESLFYEMKMKGLSLSASTKRDTSSHLFGSLLNTYRVRGTFLGPGNIVVKNVQVPILRSLQSSAVIFNLFHLIAHINLLLKFCGTNKEYIVCLSDKKNRYNFHSFVPDGCFLGCCHFFIW